MLRRLQLLLMGRKNREELQSLARYRIYFREYMRHLSEMPDITQTLGNLQALTDPKAGGIVFADMGDGAPGRPIDIEQLREQLKVYRASREIKTHGEEFREAFGVGHPQPFGDQRETFADSSGTFAATTLTQASDVGQRVDRAFMVEVSADGTLVPVRSIDVGGFGQDRYEQRVSG